MVGRSSNKIVIDTVISEDNVTKNADVYEWIKIIDKNKGVLLKENMDSNGVDFV